MSFPEKVVETDVLVVGAGLAGFFSSIHARDLKVKVLLVDKGPVAKTGQSALTGGYFFVFNPEWGHDFDEVMRYLVRTGEYVNNRQWTEILMRESYERVRDLVSWGIPFMEKDGNIYPKKLVTWYVHYNVRESMVALKKKALESGVKILDRIMITDLLKHDGRVVGAVGFHSQDGDFYTIKAKATVISAGPIYFKGPSFGRQFCSGDGHAIGYRAGAELMGLESFPKDCPFIPQCDTVQFITGSMTLGQSSNIFLNGKGEPFVEKYHPQMMKYGQRYFTTFASEVHAGRGPIYYNFDALSPDERKRFDEGLYYKWTARPRQQLERSGLIPKGKIEYQIPFPGTHGGFGGIRISTEGASSVSGLYAAGDSTHTGALGMQYPGLGFCLCNAAVTGYRAGEGAAKYALQAEKSVIDEKKVARLKEITYAPLRREGGFSPDYVTTRIQQVVCPYDILLVKHGNRLEAALTMIEFFKDHFVPKLKASDVHDLRKAHEVRNMVVGAEMILRASLLRTESRGEHYREDYPRRDDENWLKWTALKEEKGKMKTWTVPIPREWWPDLSMPYEERYPFKFTID